MDKLKIYTSFITENNIKKIVSLNYLPIFIVRSIGKIKYADKWKGTILHFKELSPESELYWEFRDGKIDYETYYKKFLIQISSLDLQDILSKLECLVDMCNASGIVLCGMGKDPEQSHRLMVSDILWRVGKLTMKPEELEL